jgi:hypothetical protein
MDPPRHRLVNANIPKRQPYGTSHLRLPRTVDVVAPAGSFIQTPGLPVRQPPRADQSRSLSLSPRKSASPHKRPSKHVAQYRNWVNDTIPAIIPAYLTLLRTTSNLKFMNNVQRPTCGCGVMVHRLRVVCVSQDSKPIFIPTVPYF